ncbi:dicarboxylate/amino acid:cation symporter [Salicibibacter halophilus]|uniref:Dicarboxylate/amino acid:cation symporter n=1 Tax=Salicibibacter halophilus TaxID=2502791 RepID=A0A514LKK1_9BACI|nr:dicarboxylate/amino acid:cation symporter [Salicibibacter halophilus]QDI92400.1 dicarboxylate/amino acid:cation symporter [Salicibibacter halophilus]
MRISLVYQILIAFILAIIFGAIFGEAIEVVEPLGELFLRLIQFVIIPLILAALITGVTNLGTGKQMVRLGGKTVAYFLITSLIAISIGLSMGFLFNPGEVADIDEPTEEEVDEELEDAEEQDDDVIDVILNIVPENPIEGMAAGDTLQVIFFALALGIGILVVGERADPLKNFFDGLAEVMFKITAGIIKLAPLGVFGILAPVVGEHGLAVLMPLLVVIAALAVGCLIHILVVYGSTVRYLGKISPLKFFKGMTPAFLFAFSSASSAATIPLSMKNVQENVGVSNKTSSFIIPLGATINMDGTTLYNGVAVMFIAQFYGIQLSFLEIATVMIVATLAAIGTAGVPGAGLIMLTITVTAIGLPIEGIALVAAIDRILDMIRTGTNILGDSACAVYVERSEHKDKAFQSETNETA